MSQKLPAELKRRRGTLNVTREKQNPGAEDVIAQTSVILPEDARVAVPKSITEPKVRKFFKETVKNLLSLRVLSAVDIPQIETMCVTLQKLHEVQAEFMQLDMFDEKFDAIEKRFERLGKRFDELARLFYISPDARTRLKLNDLTLIKTAQEIRKNDNAIGALLAARKIRRTSEDDS